MYILGIILCLQLNLSPLHELIPQPVLRLVQYGSLYSLDWTTWLDYWTGLLDSQIPTKMSKFSAVDSPRLQLCPLLCQYIWSNRLSSHIEPSNVFKFSLASLTLNTRPKLRFPICPKLPTQCIDTYISYTYLERIGRNFRQTNVLCRKSCPILQISCMYEIPIFFCLV